MRGIRGRLSSASPLVGKGTRRGLLPSMDLDDLMNLAAEQQRIGSDPVEEEGLVLMDVDDEQAAGLRQEANDEDFELYGPAAAVDTQTAGSSQWMRQVLEQEALNFLGFVENMLAGGGGVGGGTEEREGEGEDGEGEQEMKKEISMDELLPPEKNSAVVGAQALLHVLSLVTKGLMGVRQTEGFGEIVVWVEAGKGSLENQEEDEEESGDSDREADRVAQEEDEGSEEEEDDEFEAAVEHQVQEGGDEGEDDVEEEEDDEL